MEAREFLKEINRMCSSYKECTDCPLKELASFSGYKACRIYMLNECEKAISAVDAWSKEHPLVTNRMKIREVFGEIEIKDLFNCRLKYGSEDYTEIEILETKWWDKPYKEPEHEN